MNTVINKTLVGRASLKTTVGKLRPLSAARALTFASGILEKYSQALGAELSEAMLVFLKRHTDDADTERRRRESIRLALRLVFIKYLTERAGTRYITVNNTFADYISAAKQLTNEHLRIQSPYYYSAVLSIEQRLMEAKDTDSASAALMEYLSTEVHGTDREYFTSLLDTVLIAQAADDAGMPISAASSSSASILRTDAEVVHTFSEFVLRKNTSVVQTALQTAEKVISERTSVTETVHTDVVPAVSDTVSEASPEAPIRVSDKAEPLIREPANAEPTEYRQADLRLAPTLTTLTSHGFRYIMDTFRRSAHKRFSTETYIRSVYTGISRHSVNMRDSVLECTLELLTSRKRLTKSDRHILDTAVLTVYRSHARTVRHSTAEMLDAMSPREHTEVLLLVYKALAERMSTVKASAAAETQLLHALTLDTSHEVLRLMTVSDSAEKSSILIRLKDFILSKGSLTVPHGTVEAALDLVLSYGSQGNAADVFPVVHTLKPVRAFSSLAQSRTFRALGLYPMLRSADGRAVSTFFKSTYTSNFSVLEADTVNLPGDTLYSASPYLTAQSGTVLRYLTRLHSDGDAYSDTSVSVITLTGDRLTAVSSPRAVAFIENTASRILRESVHTAQLQTVLAAQAYAQSTRHHIDRVVLSTLRQDRTAAERTIERLIRELYTAELTEGAAAEPSQSSETRAYELIRSSTVMQLRTQINQINQGMIGDTALAGAVSTQIREVLSSELRREITSDSHTDTRYVTSAAERETHEIRERMLTALTRLAGTVSVFRRTQAYSTERFADIGHTLSEPLTHNETHSLTSSRVERLRVERLVNTLLDVRMSNVSAAPVESTAYNTTNISNTTNASSTGIRYDTAEYLSVLPAAHRSVQIINNSFLTSLAADRIRMSRRDNANDLASRTTPTGMVLNTRQKSRRAASDGKSADTSPSLLSFDKMTVIRTDRIHLDRSRTQNVSISAQSRESAVSAAPAPAEPRPDVYARDAAMRLKKEAPAVRREESDRQPSPTQQELVARFGNLIDSPSVNMQNIAASGSSVFGAEPADTTEKLLRDNAEQIASNRAHIDELEKKQALLEDTVSRYGDPRRLYDEVMRKLKNQIRLEKSRYMG